MYAPPVPQPRQQSRTSPPVRRCACGGIIGPGGECAACKAKRLALQRKAAGGASTSRGAGVQAAGAVLRAPGQPLAPAVRARMEHRLGHALSQVRIDPVPHGSADPGESFERAADRVAMLRMPDTPARRPVDLAHVRVYTGPAADTAARATDADAFTVGNAIAFRAGHYRPHTRAGDRLLAHELTHVVQQSRGGIALQRQSIGERRMHYEEQVDTANPPTADPSGTWSGTVHRTQTVEEYRQTPAHGRTPASTGWQRVRSIPQHTGDVNVEFDPHACTVRVPLRLVFYNPFQQPPGTYDPCANVPPNATPRTPLPTDTYSRMRREFTSALNEGLNGWYRARIDGCASGPCAGRDIPIQIDAVDGGPPHGRDQDVSLINAAGRSCVSGGDAYIYARGGDSGRPMWVHEAGHFALGEGDEYAEKGKPPERVTHDYSTMSEAEWSRLGIFQERHYAFVPAFLDDVLHRMGQQGCRTSLRETPRSLAPSLNVTFGGGYASFPTGGGPYLDLGFETGIPTSRRRDWEGIVGAHARLLTDSTYPQREAFLLGVRLGIERRWGGSGHGLALGTFGELGGGAFNLGGEGGAQYAGYAEAGGYLQYRAPLRADYPSLRLEGAAGTRLDTPGQIGAPGAGTPLPSLPEQNWVRLGVQAVWTW